MSEERKATIFDLARFEKYFCISGVSCSDCPLTHKNNGEHIPCDELIRFHSEKASKIILKWCDENPETKPKTYADDFFEKFPKAEKNQRGIPKFCRNVLYSERKCCSLEYKTCEACWNEPMPEEVISKMETTTNVAVAKNAITTGSEGENEV